MPLYRFLKSSMGASPSTPPTRLLPQVDNFLWCARRLLNAVRYKRDALQPYYRELYYVFLPLLRAAEAENHLCAPVVDWEREERCTQHADTQKRRAQVFRQKINAPTVWKCTMEIPRFMSKHGRGLMAWIYFHERDASDSNLKQNLLRLSFE